VAYSTSLVVVRQPFGEVGDLETRTYEKDTWNSVTGLPRAD
jgi:hypothetical protein